jgi:hypothetical protein
MFAMELVTSLQDIKAKRDYVNRPLNSCVPLVLPTQLIKLRTRVFIQEVLDPFRVHFKVLTS